MIQVSYLSRASGPMSAEDLLALLLQSRTHNAARGVTGMLLYGNQTFLQVVEGDDAVVDELVARISKDPRHGEFRVLSRRSMPRRQYSDWTMGFERITDDGLKQIDGLRDFGEREFTFDYLSSHEAVVETLMEHFRAPHWDPLIREIDAKDKVIEHLKKSLLQVRGRVEVAALVLESVTEAGRKGALSEAHLRLCDSALGALRQS
jgi:hypothetical protein